MWRPACRSSIHSGQASSLCNRQLDLETRTTPSNQKMASAHLFLRRAISRHARAQLCYCGTCLARVNLSHATSRQIAALCPAIIAASTPERISASTWSLRRNSLAHFTGQENTLRINGNPSSVGLLVLVNQQAHNSNAKAKCCD